MSAESSTAKPLREPSSGSQFQTAKCVVDIGDVALRVLVRDLVGLPPETFAVLCCAQACSGVKSGGGVDEASVGYMCGSNDDRGRLGTFIMLILAREPAAPWPHRDCQQEAPTASPIVSSGWPVRSSHVN